MIALCSSSMGVTQHHQLEEVDLEPIIDGMIKATNANETRWQRAGLATFNAQHKGRAVQLEWFFPSWCLHMFTGTYASMGDRIAAPPTHPKLGELRQAIRAQRKRGDQHKKVKRTKADHQDRKNQQLQEELARERAAAAALQQFVDS